MQGFLLFGALAVFCCFAALVWFVKLPVELLTIAMRRLDGCLAHRLDKCFKSIYEWWDKHE